MELRTVSEAKALGLSRFFTGELCDNGHLDERYVCNLRCCECSRQSVRANRKANPDRTKELYSIHGKRDYEKHREVRLAACAIYRKKNEEKVKASRKILYERVKKSRIEYNKRYAAANPEKARKWVKQWEQRFPEKKRQRRRDYQARKIGAMPMWADREKIASVYLEAERLTKKTGISHHVDHIVPLKGKNVSGLHVEYNLRAIPWIDNLRKSNGF